PSVNCTDTLCTVTATISIGSNQSAVIKSPTPIAVVHLVGKADTTSTGTQLAFVTGANQALSVGSSDQAAENVFQSGTPTTIVIGNNGSADNTTPTVSPTSDQTQTQDTSTDTGTGSTGTGTGTSGTNTAVTCTSFTPDNASGNAPLTVTFTSVGTSSTDSI